MIQLVRKIKTKFFQILKLEKEPFYTKEIFRNKKYIIGDFTYGHPNVIFEDTKTNLYIGKFCSIAEGVTIFLGGNHRVDWITTYPFNSKLKIFPEADKMQGHPASKGDVVIGNDVWIGRNATILSGVKIGNGAVLAAEALLSKNIGAYEIWGGNPAVFLKKRFDDETIKNLERISWWNWDLKKIRVNIERLCSNDIKKLIEASDKKN